MPAASAGGVCRRLGRRVAGSACRCRRLDRAAASRRHPGSRFGIRLHRTGTGESSAAIRESKPRTGARSVCRSTWRRYGRVVGRTALENVLGAAEAKARNGLAGALEEDARLTALFLWTLQATTDDETRDAADDDGAAADADDEPEDDGPAGKAKGFSLVFDVVRRFAQPLGIDLPKWEKRTIETKKGVVRLLPVAERAKQLFGERGAQDVAAWLEQEALTGPDALQGVLFPDRQERVGSSVRERRPRYGDSDGASDERSETTPGARRRSTESTPGCYSRRADAPTSCGRLCRRRRSAAPTSCGLSNALSALYPRAAARRSVCSTRCCWRSRGRRTVPRTRGDAMEQIRLRNFRCFREEQTARMAPLTLLVGENSTGQDLVHGADSCAVGCRLC